MRNLFITALAVSLLLGPSITQAQIVPVTDTDQTVVVGQDGKIHHKAAHNHTSGAQADWQQRNADA
jgi:hypothetical protein